MTINKLSDLYQQYLFIVFLPLTFILWLLLVTGKPFIIGAHTIVMVSLLAYIAISLKKIKLDINYFLVIFFILYCFILTSIHYSSYDLIDIHGRSLAKYHYNLYILFIVSYLYGRFIKFQINTLNTIILAITLFLTFSLVDIQTFSIDFSLIDEDKRGVYLALSNLFSIFFIFFISNVKNNNLRLLMFVIGCLSLFILNSRSSLYIFIIIFLFYQALYSNLKSRFFSLILVSSIFIIFFTSSYSEKIMTNNTRMFAIINNLDEDASQQSRNMLFKVGLRRTLEAPIAGDYGGVIHEFGSIGSYIHNIVSYWQNFGLVPFILAIFFFIYQPLKIAYQAYLRRHKFNTAIYINLSIYLVILIIFSKSYAWYYAWFLLGYIHTYYAKSRQMVKRDVPSKHSIQ